MTTDRSSTSPPGSSQAAISSWLLGALVLVVVVRLVSLALVPLADTTEARYADIARRMAELNDWVTPWFTDDVPFWGKPPLYTWMSAAGIEVLGLNEFAVRLPHLLAGILVAWLVWQWRRDHGEGRREAWLSVVLLAGSALYFLSSGAVMTDMALLVGLVLAMRGFWLALHGEAAVARREAWLMFAGLAVGLLAKGPIALVMAGVPMIAWAVINRRFVEAARALPLVRGCLLMLALALPWYLLAERRTPGFLDYFLVGEHWRRFTVPGWDGDRYGNAHLEPRGMIWPFLLKACLPWTLLLPLLAWGRRATQAAAPRSWQLYLWCWALWPCLFFTASRNILWTYVLPGLPALALLGAGWLLRDPRRRRVDAWLSAGLVVTAVLFAGSTGLRVRAGEVKAAKEVVAAFEARRNAGDELLFVGPNQFSAAFYTRGQARPLADYPALVAKVEAARAAPAAGGQVYVAIRRWHDSQPPESLRARFEPVGRFQGYELLVMKP